ncbi:uncharacterized protein PAC_09478 [Phialocephala subalpina]|uniref:Uncharacterized protein n=1 Tax=Phialocephala subalpina TaxID=576137 RepID=A0A1L7X3I9_9HELO|nr:uncharacterized protein PAC_09478 [Phialocephala subalpina]
MAPPIFRTPQEGDSQDTRAREHAPQMDSQQHSEWYALLRERHDHRIGEIRSNHWDRTGSTSVTSQDLMNDLESETRLFNHTLQLVQDYSTEAERIAADTQVQAYVLSSPPPLPRTPSITLNGTIAVPRQPSTTSPRIASEENIRARERDERNLQAEVERIREERRRRGRDAAILRSSMESLPRAAAREQTTSETRSGRPQITEAEYREMMLRTSQRAIGAQDRPQNVQARPQESGIRRPIRSFLIDAQEDVSPRPVTRRPSLVESSDSSAAFWRSWVEADLGDNYLFSFAHQFGEVEQRRAELQSAELQESSRRRRRGSENITQFFEDNAGLPQMSSMSEPMMGDRTTARTHNTLDPNLMTIRGPNPLAQISPQEEDEPDSPRIRRSDHHGHRSVMSTSPSRHVFRGSGDIHAPPTIDESIDNVGNFASNVFGSERNIPRISGTSASYPNPTTSASIRQENLQFDFQHMESPLAAPYPIPGTPPLAAPSSQPPQRVHRSNIMSLLNDDNPNYPPGPTMRVEAIRQRDYLRAIQNRSTSSQQQGRLDAVHASFYNFEGGSETRPRISVNQLLNMPEERNAQQAGQNTSQWPSPSLNPSALSRPGQEPQQPASASLFDNDERSNRPRGLRPTRSTAQTLPRYSQQAERAQLRVPSPNSRGLFATLASPRYNEAIFQASGAIVGGDESEMPPFNPSALSRLSAPSRPSLPPSNPAVPQFISLPRDATPEPPRPSESTMSMLHDEYYMQSTPGPSMILPSLPSDPTSALRSPLSSLSDDDEMPDLVTPSSASPSTVRAETPSSRRQELLAQYHALVPSYSRSLYRYTLTLYSSSTQALNPHLPHINTLYPIGSHFQTPDIARHSEGIDLLFSFIGAWRNQNPGTAYAGLSQEVREFLDVLKEEEMEDERELWYEVGDREEGDGDGKNREGEEGDESEEEEGMTRRKNRRSTTMNTSTNMHKT